MPRTASRPRLAVIAPLFNEEESIRPLLGAIEEALRKDAKNYEILFVDDGSSDRTFKIAADLASSRQYLKVICFRRNFGQTPAMAAGIDHARGEILVTMDGDLQNAPPGTSRSWSTQSRRVPTLRWAGGSVGKIP